MFKLKALIIDDVPDHIRTIRNTLIEISFRDSKLFNPENIFPQTEKDYGLISNKVKELASSKQYDELKKYVKNYIDTFDINILFVDLRLADHETESNNSGQRIISFFHDELTSYYRYLPIICTSKYEKNKLPKRSKFPPKIYIHKDERDVSVATLTNAIDKTGDIQHWESDIKNFIEIKKIIPIIDKIFFEHLPSTQKELIESLEESDLLKNDLYKTYKILLESKSEENTSAKEFIKILSIKIANKVPGITNSEQLEGIIKGIFNLAEKMN